MTAATDQFIDITRRGQEAVATAVRSWADTVQSVTSSFATGSPTTLPELHALVENNVEQAFSMAEKVLHTQRDFARTVLAASAQAAEVVTEQAARTAQAVSAHTANAAETTAEAGEKAARTAQAKS